MTSNHETASRVQTKNNLFKNPEEFLNSVWQLAILSVLIVFCWAINLPYLSLTVMLLHQIFVMIFCKNNPKALLFPLLSFTYAITTIEGVFNWIFYISFIIIFLLSIITYSIIQVKTKQIIPVRGKFFWAFVLSLVGNCLAGVVGYFDILNFTITLVLSVIVYAVYWFCLNFIKDYKRYLAWCFVFLALTIFGEIIVFYLKSSDIMYAINNKLVRVGTGEINGAAIFMLSGLCGTFYLAQKNEKDYLFLLVALLIFLGIFLTFSRIALFAAAIVFVFYLIFTIKNSQNKKIILFSLLALALIALLFCVVFFEKVKSLIAYYLDKGFSFNGREPLWKWCFENFKSHFVFGIGFVTKDMSAIKSLQWLGLQDLGGFSLVNCHNTILHYLTCTGVVGLVLNAPLYFKKYQEVFKNFSHFKLFCLVNYLAIALCGMLDSSPTISIFNLLPILMLMAFSEVDVPEQNKNNEKVSKVTATPTKQN